METQASLSIDVDPARRVEAQVWVFPRGVARLLTALAMVGVSVVVTRYAWRDLLLIAMNEPESNYVLLVPLVALWLGWERRQRLRACGMRGRWVGTLFLAAGWFLWSFGYRCEFQVFWHTGAVMMALGALLTVVGIDPMWALLPSFGALIFLVPVPGFGRDLIAVPLQRITAEATQVTAELIGMNVQRSGSLLHINGVDVAIAEACNGMRMVFALFLACYVFAFATALRWPARALILCMSPVIAVAANVVRLVPTVWAFGHISHDMAERFHGATGWVMLVAAFAGLMSFVRLLRWAGLPVDPQSGLSKA